MENYLLLPQIKSKLIQSNGEEFENIVNFILNLTETNYISTRQVRDGGVDGIKIIGKGRAIYSIYGPKNTTHWKKAKTKLNDDANAVIDFVKYNNSPLRKWNVVINRELDGYDPELIYSAGRINQINEKQIEIITPTRLIAKIEKCDVTVPVGRFLGLINYRDIPYTDLQPHAVAEEILNLLPKLKYESKEDRFKELIKIKEGIINLAYSKQSQSGNIMHIYYLIRLGTFVNKKYVKSYCYTDGLFKHCNEEIALSAQSYIQINTEGHYVFTVKSLFIIYFIVNKLIKNIDNFDIEKTLKEMYNRAHLVPNVNKIPS